MSKLRFAAAGAVIALTVGHAAQPTSDGRVTHTVNGNTETWRIDEPNVKKSIIEFQQIRFQPGDTVRVTGGGCVQTGGWGATWKRYVDPLGDNSDKLYHGMVLIPGAIGELPANDLDRFARILIIKGHNFPVKAITEPRKQHLWLGYEDSKYSDNGYNDQDAGTQGQCRIGNSWVEHAFVFITIIHGATPPAGNLAPFDISANTVTPGNAPVDDNFILLNPMWGRQITNHELPDKSQCGNGDPYSAPCTTQPTEEDHGFLCNEGTLGIVDGHHNWVAGTYEGTIFWNDKSSWIADGDYNFRLVRPDDAGMTTENKIKTGPNRKSMKLEFSSDETIDNFETPWWDAFHKAVDTDDFSAANSMVVGADGSAGAFGIVSGLIGLDCPHTCASEIHPVWAMAIRVKSDPGDETWAVFVRRFGNEGFCSDHQHYLDDLANNTFTFRLPWRQGATDVGVNPSTVFESRLGQATGALAVAKNQGVLLSFTMAVPPTPLVPGEMVNGELHLKWTVPRGGVIRPPLDGMMIARDRRPPRPVIETAEDDPEDRLARLLTNMSPAQRKVITTKAPEPRVVRQKVALRLSAPSQIASLPNRGALIRRRRPTTRAVPDLQKQAQDRQRLDALHAVYGTNIPGFPKPRVRPTPRPRVP
jgi:hypothetical protein